MARKIYVGVITRLILDMEEGIHVGDVISDLDYEFKSGTEGADVADTEIIDYQVKDSK